MVTLALFSRSGVKKSAYNLYVIPFISRIAADSGFFEGQSCLVSKLNDLL
jgi:hypothetical protein